MRISARAVLLAALAAIWLPADAAHGQAFPTRPIKLVVPFSPGTSSDIGARRLGQGLETVLGVPVIVENVVGAGGINGMQRVASAPADGYTLGIGTVGTHAINLGVYKALPYHPIRSFEPVTRFITFPNVVVVHPALDVRDMAGLVALARRRGAEGRPLSYASGGSGTTAHLGGEQLKQAAGVDLVHVPYRGAAAAMPDLLSGRVDMMFGNISVVFEQVRAGSLRALANTGTARSDLMPQIPAVGEVGMKQLELSNWLGVFAPAGTPAEITGRLRSAVHRTLAVPALKAAFAQEGTDLVEDDSAAAFTRFIEAEMDKWTGVTRAAGIAPQ
ncbi:Bug family tripartite tricarboxylate transporter substrate binding protein [Enterovirga rhinocerotis]|uniref:Tripartite-type tricarboxylate transporter receptor subunit TctC n=1 Tax=Enterovirga rhinocerotis TaxID=1339210 RepID=A0A4R7C417_9HYPH|nr:tripartite tricarboxylate transporter substrate binding protein [Enterovirga rhinocerotis]TDR92881.1 tripartite-type tricarboxylate transporter receptor subunit TctC [Enterovirga rhinocerotis]